jgi:hypothetical protein
VAYERSEAMRRTRWNHRVTFKSDGRLAQLAEHFQVHPILITDWKQQLLAWAADVFGGARPLSDRPDLKTVMDEKARAHLRDNIRKRAMAL